LLGTRVGQVHIFLKKHYQWSIGTLIAFTALVIAATGPLSFIWQSSTSANETALSVAVTASGSGSFAVPVDAPFESFPQSLTQECNPRQLDWLRQNAAELPNGYEIALSNSAEAGGSVTFSNLRTESMASEPTARRFLFECRTELPSNTYSLPIEEEGQSASVARSSPDGLSFSQSLEPGQSSRTQVVFDGSRYDLDSTLLVDVTAPGDELQERRIGAVSRPGLGPSDRFSVSLNGYGGFRCSEERVETVTQCSPSDVRVRIYQLWEEGRLSREANAVVNASLCISPAVDGGSLGVVWRDFFQGGSGAFTLTATGSYDRVVVEPILALAAKCGREYMTTGLAHVGLLENQWRLLQQVLTPGGALPDRVSQAAANANRIADTVPCDPAAPEFTSSADALGDTVGEVLGASWSLHESFEVVARQPIRALRVRCGPEVAVEFVSQLSVLGDTWEALYVDALG
jgi:hypothetical protein